jgi:SAM-dependent methyltransferase
MDMLEYYNKNHIVPVHQSAAVDDFINFSYQREILYLNLGVSMNLLADKSILEFGPGTGDNASVLLTKFPRLLDLVDGNDASQASINKLIIKNESLTGKTIVNLHTQDARNFNMPLDNQGEISSGYDLVICEGVINGNEHPAKLLTHISSFVKPGGNLIITTVSAMGVLDQALRRTFKPSIYRKSQDYREQVKICSDIFRNHLKNLPTTKPIEDWVQDAILHPLSKEYIFDTVDAIFTLSRDFIAVGASPNFYQDFRWHKGIKRDYDNRNDEFIKQYKAVTPMLIDSRKHDYLEVANNKVLETLVVEIWNISCDFWNNNSYENFQEFIRLLEKTRDLLCNDLPDVTKAIDEYLVSFPEIMQGNYSNAMPFFEKWWGRGLTYLSFRKLAN